MKIAFIFWAKQKHGTASITIKLPLKTLLGSRFSFTLPRHITLGGELLLVFFHKLPVVLIALDLGLSLSQLLWKIDVLKKINVDFSILGVVKRLHFLLSRKNPCKYERVLKCLPVNLSSSLDYLPLTWNLAFVTSRFQHCSEGEIPVRMIWNKMF